MQKEFLECFQDLILLCNTANPLCSSFTFDFPIEEMILSSMILYLASTVVIIFHFVFSFTCEEHAACVLCHIQNLGAEYWLQKIPKEKITPKT